MNIVVWRLHPLIDLKKDNNLGSRGKKKLRTLLFPRDSFARLKKVGWLNWLTRPGSYSLVCRNRHIVIVKNGSLRLSPLKIWVKERYLRHPKRGWGRDNIEY